MPDKHPAWQPSPYETPRIGNSVNVVGCVILGEVSNPSEQKLTPTYGYPSQIPKPASTTTLPLLYRLGNEADRDNIIRISRECYAAVHIRWGPQTERRPFLQTVAEQIAGADMR